VLVPGRDVVLVLVVGFDGTEFGFAKILVLLLLLVLLIVLVLLLVLVANILVGVVTLG
jgi:hypothetical protein